MEHATIGDSNAVGFEIDKSQDDETAVYSLTFGKGFGGGVFHLITNTPGWSTWDTDCNQVHAILF
jgi:hypothetical protein